MQSIRTTARWLRLALALVFAAISVAQVSTMAAARAAGSPHHVLSQATAPASHADHHSSHSGHRHGFAAVADIVDNVSVCHVMGCCVIALALPASDAPVALYILIGVLDLTPARTMQPAPPGPVDPPPRLQV